MWFPDRLIGKSRPYRCRNAGSTPALGNGWRSLIVNGCSVAELVDARHAEIDAEHEAWLKPDDGPWWLMPMPRQLHCFRLTGRRDCGFESRQSDFKSNCFTPGRLVASPETRGGGLTIAAAASLIHIGA